MKKKYKFVLFWIRSNRGTDDCTVRKFPASITKDQIEESLEAWCANFGAWSRSESYVSYGYKFVKDEDRKVLIERWNKLCKQRAAVEKRWQELRARLNPVEIRSI